MLLCVLCHLLTIRTSYMSVCPTRLEMHLLGLLEMTHVHGNACHPAENVKNKFMVGNNYIEFVTFIFSNGFVAFTSLLGLYKKVCNFFEYNDSFPEAVADLVI